jgi:multiple antibiotic resistance protein
VNALSFGALCFSSLFTVIDPIAAAPVFTSITRGESRAAVRRIAVRACAVALVVLALFAVSGAFVFRLFGITIDAFRIGGGIVFLLIGIPMLTGAGSHGHAEAEDAAKKGDPSVVPLGVPLIAGPGAITTIMLLMGQSQGMLQTAALFAALFVAIVATSAVLVVAPAIMGRLGSSGLELVTRVMGLIVVVIGVQFVIDGARPIAVDILRSARL